MELTTKLLVLASLVTLAVANPCLICDSNQNSACVNPDGTQFSTTCPQTTPPGCYARVVDQGTRVLRGCLYELTTELLSNCRNETDCSMCQTANCNLGLFPSHRLFCHQCTSSNSTNCTGPIPSGPGGPCPVYHLDDQCFVRKVENGGIERGCVSSAESCRNDPNCNKCSGHNCNFEEYKGGAAVTNLAIGTLISGLLIALLNQKGSIF